MGKDIQTEGRVKIYRQKGVKDTHPQEGKDIHTYRRERYTHRREGKIYTQR